VSNTCKWDLRKPPTNAWTSLIGSSPGHMLSGRQSHVNLKSKEAWFYEHLPVLILAINLFWRKTCYWTQILFSQNNNRCYSLAFSLNCICFETYWLAMYFQCVLTDHPACIFGTSTICWQLRFVMVEKRSYTFQLKWYAAINMITYYLVRS